MQNNSEPLTIKLVVVGDGSVGKTCILLSYTTDKFPSDYVPTVFDNYTTQLTLDNQMINLSLWDTAGQETYSRLRTLSYGSADIFLIIFSVVENQTFENVQTKWYPELREGDLEKVPKIVVGNKIDMRDINNKDHIKKEAAIQVLSQQNLPYFECSALTQEGLTEVFDSAVRLACKSKLSQKSEISNNLQSNPQKQIEQKRQEDACCIIS